MPFNGSGTFTRVYNWVSDKASAINITASRMDTEMDGMATGLSTCLTKDGQQNPTANLPMASFRHTGVGNAAARTDYAAAGQIQDGGLVWIAAGGAADAITATYSPAITAVVDGMELRFRATAANATTTPTFSPNGLTARTITKLGGTALAAGDIAGNLAEYTIRYNSANTRWELLNPSLITPFVDTSPLVKGSADATKLIRFEVDGNTTGTTRVYTVPDFNGTLATLAGTETLTNKTLQDSTTVIVDDGDATKKLAFQCSSITAGTTRTLTVPDASGTIRLTTTAVTTAQSTPADPTGTTSATQVMMGLAGSITPTTTGKVLIVVSGDMQNSSGSGAANVQIRYGTGSAPTNGAAATGTTVGGQQRGAAFGAAAAGFSLQAIVSGLTPSTAYWIDLGLAAVTTGTASIKNISISAVEL